MLDFAKRRSDKQPLEYQAPAAFSNVRKGIFAGQLIEQAGLKGYRIGGACVSENTADLL